MTPRFPLDPRTDPLFAERIEDQPQSEEEEVRRTALIRARCDYFRRKAGFPLEQNGSVCLD